MERRIQQCMVAGMVLLLFVPMVLIGLKKGQAVDLIGAVVSSEASNVSFTSIRSWWNGQAQKKVESWFDAHFPYRTQMIRTENELSLRVFHEMARKSNSHLVLGKDRYLYEYAYIDSFVGRYVRPIEEWETYVQKLKQLEELFRKNGKQFVFVISPNKASVYAEYVPERMIDKEALNKPYPYDVIRDLLDRYEVTYIDGHAITKEIKDAGEFESFTRGGTHWNYYAACVVSQRILVELDRQSGKKSAGLNCDPLAVDTTVYGTDQDIANLANIWSKQYFVGPTPHPAITYTLPKQYKQYKPVFVGGSFSWTLIAMFHAGAIDEYTFLYYYMHVYDQNGSLDGVDPNVHLADYNFDTLILEQNESAFEYIYYNLYNNIDNLLAYAQSLDKK